MHKAMESGEKARASCPGDAAVSLAEYEPGGEGQFLALLVKVGTNAVAAKYLFLRMLGNLDARVAG